MACANDKQTDRTEVIQVRAVSKCGSGAAATYDDIIRRVDMTYKDAR